MLEQLKILKLAYACHILKQTNNLFFKFRAAGSPMLGHLVPSCAVQKMRGSVLEKDSGVELVGWGVVCGRALGFIFELS